MWESIPRGFMTWKRTTFNSMMAWHEVLTHVKRRQPFNEDVFEASVLRLFIVSFKRFYDEYLLGFFFTICWSLNLWMIYFPFQNVIANRCVCGLSVCVCVCVYIHVSQAIICTFYQCQFQKMVGWVAFKFSLPFMLKLKSFKMWRPMSLFILLRFLLCVRKVIPNRKVMSWGMCSL